MPSADTANPRSVAQSNPCCAKVKEALSRSEAKRSSLRQAINLLEQQIAILESNKKAIQKEYETEKARADIERQEKEKEIAARHKLEEELLHSSKEIDALKIKESSHDQCENKIRELQELLQKKRKRLTSAIKQPSKKNKAAELSRVVRKNNDKIEENRMHVEQGAFSAPASLKASEKMNVFCASIPAKTSEKMNVSSASARAKASEKNTFSASLSEKASKKKDTLSASLPAKSSEKNTCAASSFAKASEKSTFSVASPTKASKKKNTFSVSAPIQKSNRKTSQQGLSSLGIPEKLSENISNEKIGQQTDQSGILQLGDELNDAQIYTSPYCQNDVLYKTNSHKRSRKNQENLGSVTYFSLEEKKRLMDMEQKVATLHELLCVNSHLPVLTTPKRSKGSAPIGRKRAPKNSKESPLRLPEKITAWSKHCIFPYKKEVGNSQTWKLETAEDCMKLLDLDDEIDEKKYRIAIAKPLSPTLPKLRLPRHKDIAADESLILMNRSFNEFAVSQMDGLNQCRFDVLDVEVNCNMVRAKPSDSPKILPFDALEYSSNSNADQGSYDKNIHDTFMNDMSNTCGFVVVFSAIRECKTIKKLLHARIACLLQISFFNKVEEKMLAVLLAVAAQENLLPEERASLLLSMLLYFFLKIASSANVEDSFVHSNHFTAEIDKAMLNAEVRSLILDISKEDVLFTVIENFLMEKRIMIPVGGDSVNWYLCKSRTAPFLVDDEPALEYANASNRLLIAGATILATLCKATNRVDFICGTSYNLLKIENGSLDALSILHQFAYICENDYLEERKCSLIMIAVKSIIPKLEKQINLEGHNCNPVICRKCPFPEVSMDWTLCLLLKKLQTCKNSGTGCMNFEVFDVIPLLELLSHYMNWECVHGKVLPCLYEMLESSCCDELLAAVVLLIGQIGRFFMLHDEQKGIDEVSANIFTFLILSVKLRRSLAVQLAAVSAISDTLSLECKNLFQGDDINLSGYGSIKTGIKTWFNDLSNEHQSLSWSFFNSLTNEI